MRASGPIVQHNILKFAAQLSVSRGERDCRFQSPVMLNQATISLVSRAPIFRGLPLRVCSQMIERVERKQFAPDETIIEEGADGDIAYLVVSGEVRHLPTSRVELEPVTIGPGTMIGEMAMLIPTTYGSTIIAEQETQCLCFSRAMMHELMQSDPTIASHFIEKIRQRLTIFAEKLRVLDSHVASDSLGMGNHAS